MSPTKIRVSRTQRKPLPKKVAWFEKHPAFEKICEEVRDEEIQRAKQKALEKLKSEQGRDAK